MTAWQPARPGHLLLSKWELVLRLNASLGEFGADGFSGEVADFSWSTVDDGSCQYPEMYLNCEGSLCLPAFGEGTVFDATTGT